jgi:hypothetical protein
MLPSLNLTPCHIIHILLLLLLLGLWPVPNGLLLLPHISPSSSTPSKDGSLMCLLLSTPGGCLAGGCTPCAHDKCRTYIIGCIS